ncbi:SEC-C domain-containing protein [Chryseomicrobium sp. FSL W7-1435]|uniref:SEC-C domain-containing protein n=1 Tax=Chryseomicrobium sp. FSL W7-1435 TaxID=2921704 RepID=UPI00315A5A2D
MYLEEELFQEFKKVFKKFEKQWSQPIDPDIQYREALNRFSKVELDEVRKEIELKNASQLSKAKLGDVLASEKIFVLDNWLPYLTTKQTKTLRKVAGQGRETIEKLQVSDPIWWRMTTLMIPGTVGDEFVMVVPEDLREEILLSTTGSNFMEQAKKNDQIVKIASGFASTYGVVEFSTFYKGLMNYGILNESDDSYRTKNLLWKQQAYQMTYHMDGHLLGSSRILDLYDFYAYTQTASGKEPVELSLAQLMSRGSTDYFHTIPAYKNLRRQLTGKYQLPLLQADEFLNNIYSSLIQDDIPDFFIEQLTNTITVKSIDDANELFDLLHEATEHTPSWGLKGHLPKDVKKEQEKQSKVAPSQAPPRRNDLCPCGSGKKYKKCCQNK